MPGDIDIPLSPRGRIVALDLLRLLAILMVFGRHMGNPPKGQTWMLTWQRGGWVGVDLFFVLSGFLVAGLLFAQFQAERRLSIGRFFVRRGWKIYPPFFVLIAVTVTTAFWVGRPLPLGATLSEIFFLQSYVRGIWKHTWSLAVEEHFYLLLPLTLTAIASLNRRSAAPLRPVLKVAGAVAVLSLAARLATWWWRPYGHYTNLFATHLRLDSLFFGVALSYVYHFHYRQFAMLRPCAGALLGAGLLLLTPPFFLPLEKTPFVYTIGLSIFYLGSGMMLVGAVLLPVPKTWPLVALATLGAYSYSIYLWHVPVRSWAIPAIERAVGHRLEFHLMVLIYVALSLAAGVIMAVLVEVPVLRLRDRWFPSPAKAMAKPLEDPSPAIAPAPSAQPL